MHTLLDNEYPITQDGPRPPAKVLVTNGELMLVPTGDDGHSLDYGRVLDIMCAGGSIATSMGWFIAMPNMITDQAINQLRGVWDRINTEMASRFDGNFGIEVKSFGYSETSHHLFRSGDEGVVNKMEILVFGSEFFMVDRTRGWGEILKKMGFHGHQPGDLAEVMDVVRQNTFASKRVALVLSEPDINSSEPGGYVIRGFGTDE